MPSKKLNDRAKLLLLCVYNATQRDWATLELKAYFIPHSDGNWVEERMEKVWVRGTDGQTLESLRRRGLIEQTTRMREVHPYAYALTEDGLVAAQEICADLEASGFLAKQQAEALRRQEEEDREWRESND